MSIDPLFEIGFVVFVTIMVAIMVADIYLNTFYQGLGRRVLLRFSSGRFPPVEPNRLQRLLTSVAGLAVIGAVLLLVLLATKLLA